MVRKVTQFIGFEKLDDFDVYQDVIRARAQSIEVDNRLCEYQIFLGENEVDADYGNFLLSILTKAKSVEPNKKRKENGDVSQHDNYYHAEEKHDPQYELFLKCLIDHEKSYVLKFEKSGLPVVVKYEEDFYSDRGCDPEPRRKLRSAMKQKIGPSNQISDVGNQCKDDSQLTKTENLTQRILRNKAKSEKAENANCTNNRRMPDFDYPSFQQAAELVDEGNASLDKKCDLEPRKMTRSAMKPTIGPSNHCKHDLQSAKKTKNPTGKKSRTESTSEKALNEKCTTNEMVPDPDYLIFHQNAKVRDDYYVFMYGGHTVVYEKNDGENIRLKEEEADEFLSDVEILDRTPFYKEGNLDPSMAASTEGVNNMNKDSMLNGIRTMTSEFRQQLITLLRRPYDKEERDKLWQDINLRKPEERHMDMRNGRERSWLKNKDGKSFLDHHLDLRKKLLQFQDNDPKCLNLLRGFFFWLRNNPQDGSFEPWNDAECLAICPEYC